MDVIYFAAGILIGSGLAYLWYLVGRKTWYQDHNIVPPPNPIGLPRVVPEKKKEEVPAGWVTEDSDPSMGDYRRGGEL